MRQVITCCVYKCREFMKPKYIGYYICRIYHEKNQSSKISCYCPFRVAHSFFLNKFNLGIKTQHQKSYKKTSIAKKICQKIIAPVYTYICILFILLNAYAVPTVPTLVSLCISKKVFSSVYFQVKFLFVFRTCHKESEKITFPLHELD